MTEDKKLAEKMVLADAKRMFKSLRELLPTDVLTFAELDNYKADKGKPFINLTIGACGKLSRSEAKDAGEMWKKIVRRWPQGPVYIHFLGYDDDPRELWEISKVTRYVRMGALCRHPRRSGRPAEHG